MLFQMLFQVLDKWMGWFKGVAGKIKGRVRCDKGGTAARGQCEDRKGSGMGDRSWVACTSDMEGSCVFFLGLCLSTS